MASLLDAVRSQLGQNEIGQISQQLGVDPSTAQSAIAAALPMMVGGMAQHASSSDGADQLQQAAQLHANAADNIGSALSAAQPADGIGGLGGILGNVFGQHQQTVQSGVQQASGLDSTQVRKLLVMLSPIVLSMLARRHFGQQNQTPGTAQANPTGQATATQSSGGLGSILMQEAQSAMGGSGGLGGMLGKMFGSH
jgi:hypothetical protein